MAKNFSNQPVAAIVTGANGWLGKGLVDAMVNGIVGLNCLRDFSKGVIRVLVMPGEDTRALSAMSNNLDVVVGDVRREADCDDLFRDAAGAVLFHTAGIIHPRRVQDFYDINHLGTVKILKSAQKYGVKRAVIVSSNSPIGCNPVTGHLFDELSPFNPYMHYGRSKMLMERSILQIQQEGRIETVRIRAPWFYGPFQPERQTQFFKMIRDGRGPIVGDGKNLRSMAYITNLAQGLLLASELPVANGKVYWIADERPYSMNEVIDTIEDVLEKDFNIVCAHKRLRLPGLAADVAWLVDKSLQSLGLYHQKFHVLSEMNKNIACSVQLAKEELGYRPQIALRQGMHNSIRWLINTYGKI